jgi:hypothetical protein
MTDLSQQTDQLLKAATNLQNGLSMIHYDLLAICLLVFVFGMILVFKKHRN